MDAESFERLVRDIRRNGQREPIVLRDGLILDGRARYAACLQLGLIPRVRISVDCGTGALGTRKGD